MFRICVRRVAATSFVALVAVSPTANSATSDAASFARFTGSWSGSGVVRLSGGNAESLRCKAYYTPGDEGQTLGIAIRCASPNANLELRATLNASQNEIRGMWEERTYNASGNVRGIFGNGTMALDIDGQGFKGSMNVTMNGSEQNVAIKTQGVPLESVSLTLARMSEGGA